MIEVIGLSGKAGTGKDFLGQMVLRRAGYHQFAFAWPMKMQALGQGATYEEVFVTKPPRIRTMLQRIGTEEGWMLYGRDYWLNIAAGWMRTLEENLGLSKFYFTDVRFPHEVDFVHKLGGKVVRLWHGDRIYPLAGTAAAEHSSETALDDCASFDLYFENNLSATPYEFRKTLEEEGILPRWDDALEAVGANADRMDDPFANFPGSRGGVPCL